MEFIVIYCIEVEIVIRKMQHGLFGFTEFGQQFCLDHFEHLEIKKALIVQLFLSLVANQRSLGNKTVRFLKMIILESRKRSKNEEFYLFEKFF